MALDPAERKRRGAWATPPRLVEFLCDHVLEPALAERSSLEGFRVLDPACGDGRILAAAVERMARRFDAESAKRCIFGVELDHATAEAARARFAVGADRIAVADGRWVPGAGGFDVVLGNPPYLSQLAAATARGGRSELGGGPYADVAVEFLAAAARAARADGGRVGLVLPQSILASRDAASVRAAVLADAALEVLWWSGRQVFDAAVLTCILGLRRGARPDLVRRWSGPELAVAAPAEPPDPTDPTWSPLVADLAGIPPSSLVAGSASGRLGDLATATADFRDQYYGLVPFVGDLPSGPPLVTVGLIDPGRCRWGERTTRFSRRDLAAPRVDVDALRLVSPRLGAWAEARLVPKVLVATQTHVPEAVVDEAGAWLPSVPVVTVVPHDIGDLWRVGAVLTAPPAAAWAAARHVGSGMSASGLRLRPAEVLAVPLPARHGPWDEAVAALRCGDVDGCAVAMCRAYDCPDPAMLAWWRAAANLDR